MIQGLTQYFLSATFIGGVIVYICKKYLDRKTEIAEKRREKEIEEKKKARVLEYELDEAMWELIRQTHRGIIKSDKMHEFWNGEYRDAYAAFETAYKEKKKFQQNLLAERR